MQKGFAPILILVVILIVSIIGGGVFWVYQNGQQFLPDLQQEEMKSLIPSTKEIIISEALSPDGQRKIMIKNSGEGDSFIRSVVISDKTGKNGKTVLAGRADADTWMDLKINNWSPDGKYFYLQVQPPDGGDLYLFKSDGSNFSGGKEYILISKISYNAMPIMKLIWKGSDKIRFLGGMDFVIKPKFLNEYEIDLNIEKLTKIGIVPFN